MFFTCHVEISELVFCPFRWINSHQSLHHVYRHFMSVVLCAMCACSILMTSTHLCYRYFDAFVGNDVRSNRVEMMEAKTERKNEINCEKKTSKNK